MPTDPFPSDAFLDFEDWAMQHAPEPEPEAPPMTVLEIAERLLHLYYGKPPSNDYEDDAVDDAYEWLYGELRDALTREKAGATLPADAVRRMAEANDAAYCTIDRLLNDHFGAEPNCYSRDALIKQVRAIRFIMRQVQHRLAEVNTEVAVVLGDLPRAALAAARPDSAGPGRVS